MNKKRIFTNLVSNIISFLVQLCINFILTPIIVLKVGDAAYGFVGLANNFVSYATIVTLVINSMASRFIAIEYTNNNEKKANQYYSSIFFINAIISVIILIISIVFIINVHHFLNIPDDLVFDVKLTFVLSFINLILSLFNTVFNVASFVKNRIDLSAIRSIIGNILKVVILIILFYIFRPKIYFIALSAIIMTIYLIFTNYKLSQNLCSSLKIKRKYFNFECIKVLAKSGIWNSINSLSKVLLTGIDLLIANIMVGPIEMGILSIAKTIPTAIESLLATFSNTFNPQFVLLYSQNRKEELIETVSYSLKIIGLIMLVPLAGIIVFGNEFFKLWLPGKTDAELLKIQILSILSILPFIVSASNYTLFVLDSVTNKLKRPVAITFAMSLLSTLTTIILLKTTNLGIYAIAGVSSIYWIFKVFFFNTINAAINLKIKWYTFFKPFFKNLSCFLLLLIIFQLISVFTMINNWVSFGGTIICVGILGYLITFIVLLNKKEKEKFIGIVKVKKA